MDPEKRKQLERKRAEARERAFHPDHRPVEGDIVPRLRQRGVPHRIPDGGVWTPSYLKVTAIRIYWEGSPEPARWDYCETPAEKAATVRAMLEEVAGPDDPLRFSYDAFGSPVEIRMADALPVLDILLDSSRTVWITSFPNEWLIESGDYDTVRLALPPPVDPEQEALEEARDRAIFQPLAKALEGAKQDYRLFRPTDPFCPPFAAIYRFRGFGWSAVEKSLSAGIARGDVAALTDTVAPFIAGRAPGDRPIVVELMIHDSPKLQAAASAIVDCLPAIVDSAFRFEPDAPGGELLISGATIYEPGAGWLVEITANGPWWTVRGTG